MAKGEDAETLGGRIARLRREKGMTQIELAERLRVSQPVVSDYENDVIRLPADTVVQIAEVLGASTDELLGLKAPAAHAVGGIKNRRLYTAHAGDREAAAPRPGGAAAHDRGVYLQGQLRGVPMNARRDEVLIEKLKSLPPEQRAEVEDFVDFLKTRRERTRDAAAQRLGEAFARLDALNLPPMSPEDIQAEIDAVRAARHGRDADRR